MKSESEINGMWVNLNNELKNHLRGDNHSLTDYITERKLRDKIKLLEEILEIKGKYLAG